MGSRGASSGIANNGKKYGTEYRTVLKSGNIKFVKYNGSKSAKAPMETMTRGRVYVTVNEHDSLVSITYFDNANKRAKTIDLTHTHAGMSPHVHHGYEHNENDNVKGATRLSLKESQMVDRVIKIWENRKRQ